MKIFFLDFCSGFIDHQRDQFSFHKTYHGAKKQCFIFMKDYANMLYHNYGDDFSDTLYELGFDLAKYDGCNDNSDIMDIVPKCDSFEEDFKQLHQILKSHCDCSDFKIEFHISERTLLE